MGVARSAREAVRRARHALAARPKWEGEARRWTAATGHPNEAARNRLAYLQLSAALEYAALRYARGQLLDIGCGTKPWRPVFAPHVHEHIGADHESTLHGLAQVDVVCDAYNVPLDDHSVDTILLTEVLEHLERPVDAVLECARLLTPGGHLIATTPFSWPLHEEPRDFYRYSPHGLRHVMHSAGLEVVEVRSLSGIWGTLALHFSYALLRYRPLAPWAVDGVSLGAQKIAWRMDRLDRQEILGWNHLVVAHLPADRSS
jgi:SAM-dependent methyltransferase